MKISTLNQSQLFESMVDSIGQGVVALDSTGNILFSNDEAARILGIGDQKVAPECWPEYYRIYSKDGITLIPPEQSPIARAISGEQTNQLEVLVRNQLGASHHIWCTLNLLPLKDETGNISGAVLLIQDISERKRLSDELARSNAALQQFATVAAHDLQEPLRSVAGFTEMLSQHQADQLDPQSIRCMSKIKDGITRMQMLINDLLSFSRIQTKPQTIRTVDCNDLVKVCLRSLDASIKASGAKVTADDLPKIMGDAPQLAQLFQNLVGNALKFSTPDRPPVVHISAVQSDHFWQFSVVDNGIGIAPEFGERIFLIFQRLHNRTEYGGTGIGLAICKEIVVRHGGKIWVESELGIGSTFHFTLQSD
ncbi:N/A [soil metagenome]